MSMSHALILCTEGLYPRVTSKLLIQRRQGKTEDTCGTGKMAQH